MNKVDAETPCDIAEIPRSFSVTGVFFKGEHGDKEGETSDFIKQFIDIACS